MGEWMNSKNINNLSKLEKKFLINLLEELIESENVLHVINGHKVTLSEHFYETLDEIFITFLTLNTNCRQAIDNVYYSKENQYVECYEKYQSK